ncbi:MAG: dihydrolipoyllysine-residue succinyltransferase [Mariprofundaceae bacterium]|nr:dihydrolipoyllysine-residue succinyltransferase [Mariprofundaceae bacterium]
MDIEIKVPSLGESESEATLVAWHKHVGDEVAEDDVLAEIESDKITMEVTAFASGVLKEANKHDGDTVEPGEVIGVLEAGKTSAKSVAAKKQPAAKKPASAQVKNSPASEISAAAKLESKTVASAKPVLPAPKAAAAQVLSGEARSEGRREERVPMSALRKTIARRLKQAQNTAAILTTFNEVNMQPTMDLRSRYRDAFKEQHGVNLGFMSFFVRACAQALRRFPAINACIEDAEIVYRNYQDIGIAVSSERGLVVPVLRDAGRISMAEIERGVVGFAEKARSGTLMPDDLKGGTFSITNGGVFGSLLSTPIINPPQSAILGMHTIQQRPIAEGGQVVIRPMMYMALSYDHRIIDGREAVQFLTTVKETLEYPGRDMLGL